MGTTENIFYRIRVRDVVSGEILLELVTPNFDDAHNDYLKALRMEMRQHELGISDSIRTIVLLKCDGKGSEPVIKSADLRTYGKIKEGTLSMMVQFPKRV